MKFWKLASVATFVLSTSANAALIDNGSYTSDTVSQLDWLDITETRNMSYNDVSSQFGAGQQFDGWRYATDTEMAGWLSSFGFDVPLNDSFCDALCYYGNTQVPSVSAANSLISLWGETYNNGFSATLFVFDTFISGAPGSGQLEDYAEYEVEVFIAAALGGSTDTSALGHEDLVTSDTSHSSFGHALVRTSVVPVPAAVWLFGSGLIGLAGFARRKKA